jgi:hypothetical protein
MQQPGTPRDVNELKKEMNAAVDYKIPAERKTSIFSAAGIIIAATFLYLSMIGFGQIWGTIITYIIIAFSLFGWDPIVTALFMSLVFLAVTVMLYVAAKRGNEAVNKMEAGLKIALNIPPTRFYDLSEVPTSNIVRELVGDNNKKSKNPGRGCKLVPHDNGIGFDVRCDDIPETKDIKALKEGKIYLLELKEKGLISIFFAVWGGLQAFVTYFGFLTGISMYIAWIIFLVAFFSVMIETRILRLWSVLLAWLGLNVFFTFTVLDAYFLWTMWGAWICFLVVVVIFYVAFKHSCIVKNSWYCDFL